MIVNLIQEQTSEATSITLTTRGRTFRLRERYGALVIEADWPLFVQWRGENEVMVDIVGTTNETKPQSRSSQTTQARS